MQKWEYLFLAINIEGKIVEINLQRVPVEQMQDAYPFIQMKGDEGWEMITSSPHYSYVCFKRPKN
ncbi:MAG TPA: hypothetical protein VGC89_11950 [Pyrinomonadaceae bacterium]|jgi:hypothetical protein